MSSQIGSLIEQRPPTLSPLGTLTPAYPSSPRPEPRLLGRFSVTRQTAAREPWSAFMPQAIGGSTFPNAAGPASGGLVAHERETFERLSRVAATDRVLTASLGLRSLEMSRSEFLSEHGETLVTRGAPGAGQTGSSQTVAVIWSLVERQQVGAARKLLSLLPDAPDRTLRALLRPPRTWMAPSRDRDRSADFRWLDQHGRDYVGRWVALAGGNLLASADSLRALRGQLRQGARRARPLIHFIR